MVNHSLISARAYEKEAGSKIPASSRPLFHLTPWIGWMNDPDGFCWYCGQYHLFYQYHPYDTKWNAMHWGHAVSHDMLHWTYLPAALAPDSPYDSFGCFSGSAIELPDGKPCWYIPAYVRKTMQRAENTRPSAWPWGTDWIIRNMRGIRCWMHRTFRRA